MAIKRLAPRRFQWGRVGRAFLGVALIAIAIDFDYTDAKILTRPLPPLTDEEARAPLTLGPGFTVTGVYAAEWRHRESLRRISIKGDDRWTYSYGLLGFYFMLSTIWPGLRVWSRRISK
jgi:hypothetical protein